MSEYYPDGVPLTPEQIKADFESANPGKTLRIGGNSFSRPLKGNDMGTNNYERVTVFNLDSELRFGKYKGTGLTVDDVIQKDAGYIQWLHENVAWFALEEEIYLDVCGTLKTTPIPELIKKATPVTEQPSQSELNGFDTDTDTDTDTDKPF